jgi:hypothetical protein
MIVRGYLVATPLLGRARAYIDQFALPASVLFFADVP